MSELNTRGIWLPILIAVITGSLAGIPALLNFFGTKSLIKGELEKIREQSTVELAQIREQGESELKLQRDRETARLMTNLSSVEGHDRAGAALALAVIGGDEVIPILIGKLRETAFEQAILKRQVASSEDEVEQERRFINALKQALLTKRTAALEQLIELNRDLKTTILHLYRSRKVQTGQGRYTEDVAVHTEALEVVKDVLRSVLVAVTNIDIAVSELPSPLATHEISLAEVDLSYMVLWRLNLSGVDLTNADLSNNRLGHVVFREALLRGATFEGAGLLSSDFSDADLTNTNLKRVFSYGGSIFRGADVENAQIDDPKFVEHLRRQGAANCCSGTR